MNKKFEQVLAGTFTQLPRMSYHYIVVGNNNFNLILNLYLN